MVCVCLSFVISIKQQFVYAHYDSGCCCLLLNGLRNHGVLSIAGLLIYNNHVDL